jgi:hypothetical protein
MASVLHPTDVPSAPTEEEREEFDRATRERIEAAAEEKERALKEPGLSWRDWLYFQAFKWWAVILFLVLDSWLAAAWVVEGSAAGLILSLVAALYAEAMLFQFLWRRPDLPERRHRVKFHRTVLRPVECGRWTPEAAMQRDGVPWDESQIDPREFL